MSLHDPVQSEGDRGVFFQRSVIWLLCLFYSYDAVAAVACINCITCKGGLAVSDYMAVFQAELAEVVVKRDSGTHNRPL